MVSKLQLVSLLLEMATAVADTIGPLCTITLANKDIAPDGFTRSASLVNGKHPGPVIKANKGDVMRINMVNQLSDPNQLLGATIHWHGMFQRGTNFMDGTDGVTQCPIAPGDSFQYIFEADEAGTFWYHSHFGVQYCDGIRGALIVYDPFDPLKILYDVDDESTIVTLSDWYHTLARNITGVALADSTLINGKGRYPGGNETQELAIVNVEQGKRYRLRLISISCDPNFTFSIDGHDLTIIEVEGVAVAPETVNSIQIFAGQRYSVILNANQTADNYWIRALPNSGNGNLSFTFDNGINSAILRYAGAQIEEPTSSQQMQKIPLAETNLRPINSPPVPGQHNPGGADQTFNFEFGFDQETFCFTINGVVFEPPTVPVLLQILNGTPPSQLLPNGSVYTLERNKTIQINFPSGLIGGPHPFHLHGHNFHVIRSADRGKFNFDKPIIRDTVSAGDVEGDFVSIRFRTDNPGPWIFHCHIDFHLAHGLAVIFAEAPAETFAANSGPPQRQEGAIILQADFSGFESTIPLLGQ